MSLKRKRKSLADKIGNLLTPAPVNFESDDEAEETKAKLVENFDESDDSDVEFRQSKFRKHNIDLLDQGDKRYEGQKVSRKDMYANDSDSTSNASLEEESPVDSEDNEDVSEDEDENNMQGTSDQQKSEEEDEGSDTEEDSKEGEEESDSEEEEDDYDIMRHDLSSKNDVAESEIKTMTDTNVKADIKKGNAVRNQLKVWENLLEFRIKLQKCLISSNQLPQYDIYESFKSDKEFVKKTNEATNSVSKLLNNMLQLQSSLLGQYAETKNLNLSNDGKKENNTREDDDTNEEIPSDMDEEIPSDTEDELQDEKKSDADEHKEKELEKIPNRTMKLSEYEKILANRHEAYTEYRNSVIQKWNDKTRLATGSANKGAAQTILKQIEFALNDKEKLRKRTQLKRSEYNILGKQKSSEEDDGRRVQEYDPEIYDDDDFYHQLLRDLIEYKSADVTDPIQLSKQWIQLQNLRSKMKRKIDTRATKGRKVRYNVHPKLVNFMAPITTYDTWTDQAKTELYKSLFGKIKPIEVQEGQ